jgi:hypothetical protein
MEVLWEAAEFTHEIEVAWAYLDDLRAVDNSSSFSDHRQHVIAIFSEVFRDFIEVSTIQAMAEATEEISDCAKAGVISRLQNDHTFTWSGP